MKKTLAIICGLVAAAALAVPFAPINYVNNAVSNAIVTAKNYTDQHTTEIDLTAYALKSNLNYRVDGYTNVVWKCVWSNGVEYIFAYSNNTNAFTGVSQ